MLCTYLIVPASARSTVSAELEHMLSLHVPSSTTYSSIPPSLKRCSSTDEQDLSRLNPSWVSSV